MVVSPLRICLANVTFPIRMDGFILFGGCISFEDMDCPAHVIFSVRMVVSCLGSDFACYS